MELRDLLNILRRRWMLAAAIFAMAAAVQYVGARLKPPAYTSTGLYRLSPVPEAVPEALRPGEVIGTDRPPVQVIVDWSEPVDMPDLMLRKRAVLERAAQILAEQGGAGGYLDADAILGALTVEPVTDSGLVRVSWTHIDREIPPRVIQAVVAAYSEFSYERLMRSYSDFEGRVAAWLAGSRTSQAEAEALLESLQERMWEDGQIIVPEFQEQALGRQVESLEQSRTENRLEIRRTENGIERERLRRQQDLAQQHSHIPLSGRGGGLGAPAELIQEMQGLRRRLRELLRTFTAEHPAVAEAQEELEALQADMRGAMREAAYEDLAFLMEKRELLLAGDEFLAELIREVYARWRAVARVRDQNQRAQEEADTLRDEVRALEIRQHELEAQRPGREAALSLLVEEMEPPTAARPREIEGRVILMILLVSLVIAGAAAFVAEYLNDRLRMTADIKAHMGLPTIGIVPFVRGEPVMILEQAERSPLAEIYNKLATFVEGSLRGAGRKVALITSTSEDEGKTTITSNVAVALARSGRRVVVIDGDLRRGTVDRVFKLDGRRGVSEYLQGQAQLGEVLQNTPVEHLRVMVAGRTPPNPVLLLKSPAFPKLIADLEAREDVDIILIDTPPILGVIDSLIMAQEGVPALFLVREGYVRRSEAAHVKSELARVGAKVLGAILNASRIEPETYYYYYYYRYRSYYTRKE